jgi:pyruvate dehydrogenase E2 component (dihydrolipoamide acetyltransferase)
VANALVMPRQGNTVESCILTRWRKAEGQSVTAEEIICEVETDKASFEVPAGTAGLVLKLLAAEGDDVPVLAPIAVIGQAGEDWQSAVGGQAATASPTASPTTATPNASAAVQHAAVATLSETAPAAAAQAPASGQAPGVSPRARSLAAAKAVDATSLGGSGPGGRVIERDVLAALESRPPLSAAALAAAKAGAALPAAGTGPGGRITVADLAGAAGAAEATAQTAPRGAAAVTATTATTAFPGAFQDTPIRSIRKIIADRMLESVSTSAQLTFNGSAPAARLQELRARMKASPEALGLAKVTVNDLVLFAVSRVLKEQPWLNAHKLGDTLRSFERVHLGMAVDTPRGLMVPVIRDADLLSLAQISTEAKRLAAACLEGHILPDELSGSTFTVTNLGSLGIESFTPILNAPEVGILGVDNITLRPVQGENGEVRFEPRLGLSLTVNHQLIDGAPAARFLKGVADALADIDLWLARQE